MMTEQLLPCPFCGSKAEYMIKQSGDGSTYWFDVQCTNNGCYLEQGADWCFDTHDEVMRMWNNRNKEE